MVQPQKFPKNVTCYFYSFYAYE